MKMKHVKCIHVHAIINVNIPHNAKDIFNCLRECGFVVIPNIYNPTTLSAIYDRFFNQFSESERDPYKELDVHIRGNLIEYGLPHFNDIPGFNEILYHPLVAESAINFMKQEMDYRVSYEHDVEYDGTFNPIVLDTVTFIEAKGNFTDIAQGLHMDSQFGIKLQIPLIDVTPTMGPIEVFPYGQDKFICGSIKGAVKIGTGILYQQTVWHRGTKNNDLSHRPVIDMSLCY